LIHPSLSQCNIENSRIVIFDGFWIIRRVGLVVDAFKNTSFNEKLFCREGKVGKGRSALETVDVGHFEA
jgi:hypothetical protein